MDSPPCDDPVDAVTEWFSRHARDLPWRGPGVSPWGVLVSEFMLQQTPVSRVLPVWTDWMQRWATSDDLAQAPVGAAIRAWGRLGYPRRALRLHACAVELVQQHGGTVPRDLTALRALPGVGTYTAAAVASFAYGQRVVVLDTNVRRVLDRLLVGTDGSQAGNPTRAERDRAARLLPTDPARAAQWSVAVMELGALVCTSRAPRCATCPVARQCIWLRKGRPAQARRARTQTYAGTDRQCRGRLLATLRESDSPVAAARLDQVWPNDVQRARALHTLVVDGLVESLVDGRFALPGTSAEQPD
ncbi:MAG: A/G-specific adenine glycosylase [Nocardioidaceae bacterium]|nr:A/G-specific adenine glycosylase [Nocardioidaceae bacterium]MDQ3324686.1 A/G-specific adenine glycosylase [Actinomycetota bacterium]